MLSHLCTSIIRSRNFHGSTRTSKDIRVAVVHTMESPEGKTTAEDVAGWFAGSNAPKASAHYCVDVNSIVGCVNERDVAWAAPGANHDGIQIELAGRAGQTAKQWADAYSRAELVNAARLVADICRRHGIPARKLTNAQLRNGARGIVGHAQVSVVYNKSDHTDPGVSFPWAGFEKDVRALLPDKRRWQIRLVDGNGKVVARSAIAGKAGIAARVTTFSARVSKKVAAMTLAGRKPRIRVVKVQ